MSRETSFVAIERRDTPAHPMHALIRLQKADGAWDLTPALAAIVGRDLRELKAIADGATGSTRDAQRGVATAVALAWLDGAAVALPGGRRWLDAARQVLLN